MLFLLLAITIAYSLVKKSVIPLDQCHGKLILVAVSPSVWPSEPPLFYSLPGFAKAADHSDDSLLTQGDHVYFCN